LNEYFQYYSWTLSTHVGFMSIVFTAADRWTALPGDEFWLLHYHNSTATQPDRE